MESVEHVKQTKEDHDLLIELKTKMDSVLSTLESIQQVFIKKQDDHEERLRSLEKTRWTWGGMITAISTGIGYLLNHILK